MHMSQPFSVEWFHRIHVSDMMEELLKVSFGIKDPGKFSQVKKAYDRCVIYVLRAIYKKFKRIVLFYFIKDLSFFTLQKNSTKVL